jgi:hypothetical protein
LLQLGIPELDPTARRGILLAFFRRRSIHLADGRPGMLVEELCDPSCRRHKRVRQVRVRSATDDYEQANPVRNHGGQLVRFVADAGVVSDRYPAVPRDDCEPLFIRAVRRAVVRVPLNAKTCVSQDRRKLVAQISVGEEDMFRRPVRTTPPARPPPSSVHSPSPLPMAIRPRRCALLSPRWRCLDPRLLDAQTKCSDRYQWAQPRR